MIYRFLHDKFCIASYSRYKSVGESGGFRTDIQQPLAIILELGNCHIIIYIHVYHC